MTKAHVELQRRRERGELTITVLARRIGIAPTSLRHVVMGAEPKVSIALALHRELGIPLDDWTPTAADG